MKGFVLFLLFMLGSLSGLFAKDKVALVNSAPVKVDTVLYIWEDSIRMLATDLYSARRNDDLSAALSQQITGLFEKIFEHPDGLLFALDSVFPIARIADDKEGVEIYTWNTVHRNGLYTHYGFVVTRSKNELRYFELKDKTYEIQDVNTASLSPDNWYGAVYYDMIKKKTADGEHYLLLGWHGNNLMSNKKVVETMYFTESGKVKFGKSLLKTDRKKYKRVVFEYSRMADMLLHYDVEMDLLVFDHLSPMDPLQTGDFQFYGPDLSYDALRFNGDFWEYVEDIDYKRPEVKKRKRR